MLKERVCTDLIKMSYMMTLAALGIYRRAVISRVKVNQWVYMNHLYDIRECPFFIRLSWVWLKQFFFMKVLVFREQ